jgi:PAS domain S-box-containing protein
MPGKNEIKANGRALFRRATFLRKLLDNMQIGIIISDGNGYLIYINDTYARFLGIDAEEQIGRFATDVIANSRLPVVARTGVAEINWPHRFKDTGFLVHRVPIKDNGKVIAVLGLVLFEDAGTVQNLAEKLVILEGKLDLYASELAALRSVRYTFDSIIGESRSLEEAKSEAQRASSNVLPVLLTGESGTGKELFAQAIHHASGRRAYPFVRVNCSAIPKDLFESELFGYTMGAFTGAHPKGKPGKFELAHRGTIFLDEIGDLPLEMQPKLLRVLESKEVERVGGKHPTRSDFRLIAATNQDLRAMLANGKFRKDLYYRINVIAIHIPPLRERGEDILLLAKHFLARQTEELHLGKVAFAARTKKILLDYPWPGNGRELLNTIERALTSLKGNIIRVDDLPFAVKQHQRSGTSAARSTLNGYLLEAERTAIRESLESAGYNKSLAARQLGIHRTLLYRKMKKLGMK